LTFVIGGERQVVGDWEVSSMVEGRKTMATDGILPSGASNELCCSQLSFRCCEGKCGRRDELCLRFDAQLREGKTIIGES
jgi:hypothetical protein